MSLVKEIEDKGATLAWSPVPAQPNFVALGMKDSSGGGFDDYGGELEIHSLDFSDTSLKCPVAGSVKTSGRFQSLAWSAMGNYSKEFSMGLIAGGMNDGAINIWDPARLIKAHPKAQLSALQAHKGAVSGVQFNPTPSSHHLLASGGADGSVFIHALDRPDTPKQPFVPAPDPNAAKHTAEISTVAWNTQVPHILASASANGSCIVWDLRQKKAWCELRDANRSSIADIAWNPLEGLQIVTGLGDDSCPVIKLWDLRSSTTLPLATLKGHQQGILSMSWCPKDTSRLLSCGKDNKTFLWDLFTCEPVYELPAEPSPTQTGGFGGFGSAMGRRYEVRWSPRMPAVISTCSFDRKVQVYSLAGTKNKSNRAPGWLKRPAGATFGFGGKLVSFKGLASKPNQTAPQVVNISTVVEDPQIVEVSQSFEQRMAQKDYPGICDEKAAKAEADGDSHEASVWKFIELIFEDNARGRLLEKLGFNAQDIQAKVDALAGVSAPSPQPVSPADTLDTPAVEKEEAPLSTNSDTSSAADFFSGEPAADATDALTQDEPPAAGAALEDVPPPAPVDAPAMTTSGADSDLVKRALLVGNFPAAVEACFQQGNIADALILASCGGAELWEKARLRYFESESKSRPYLNVVSAIITGKLSDVVENAPLSDWKETLAIVSTYSLTEDFAPLCERLGERLEQEAKDLKSASLCYLCAINVPKTVGIWIHELNTKCKDMTFTDPMALHALIEKVTVFTQEDIGSLLADPASPVGALFTQYGARLANQGQMGTASKYITAQDQATNELRHRLFYASQMDRMGAPHPPVPFQQQMIGMSPSLSGVGAQAGASQQQPTQASLPAGWLQQVDPNSGKVYYVNTMTGASQWEPPVQQQQPVKTQPSVNPQTTPTQPRMQQPTHQPVPQPSPMQQQQQPRPTPQTQPAPHQFTAQQQQQPATQQQQQQPMMMQAQPTMQQQPQTMQPQMQVAQQQQPQTMPAAAAAATDARIPKQDGFISKQGGQPAMPPATAGGVPMRMDAAAVPDDAKPIVAALNSIIQLLTSVCHSPPEKKQLGEGQKAGSVLVAKLGGGQLSPEVKTQVQSFMEATSSKDYGRASQIHKELTAKEWDSHKDWIKGIKHLLALAQKKLG